jgi:hypothetical protein
VSLQDRRDDIDAMIGARGLLRRVHDDALAPATRPPEVIVTTSADPPAPKPGDPQGYENYKAACREIAFVWRDGMRQLHPGCELPRWVAEGTAAPDSREADLAVRALIPWLAELGEVRGGERAGGRGARRKGGPLLAVKRAREALDAAAGATVVQAPPPTCRTRGCREQSVPGEHRRCRSCLDHHAAHGQYPDHVATAKEANHG